MTHLPTMVGTIERRLLVNYRVDIESLARVLPAPFRPQVVDGHGIGGICMIRLAHLRPAGMPASIGVTTENAAHRLAVEWDAPEGVRRGGSFGGLELRCDAWQVEPLDVERVTSSSFEDRSTFPSGAAEFDSALVMRNVAAAWLPREPLKTDGGQPAASRQAVPHGTYPCA